MKSRKIILGLSVIILIGAYFFVSNNHVHKENKEGVTPGMTAPIITVKDMNGNDIMLNAAKEKKVLVLNFWATWCPPCQEEMPELEQFYKKYGNKVKFVAIDVQESPETINQFFKDNGYTYPTYTDLTGNISQIFNITGIPTTIVIDTEGTIIKRITGGTSFNELESLIHKAGVK